MARTSSIYDHFDLYLIPVTLEGWMFELFIDAQTPKGAYNV